MPARRFIAGQPAPSGPAGASTRGAAPQRARVEANDEVSSNRSRPPELPEPADVQYQPPPRMVAPPAGWRPPYIVEPAPPRWLPPQDQERLDQDEARARTLTQGIAIIAAAIMVILMCAICGRVLF
jgi:hypothetical protein